MPSGSQSETPAGSLFQQILDVWGAVAPMHVSFDDLTGVTLDYPQLLLPVKYEVHNCSACVHAKSDPSTQFDCYLNKAAVNAVTLRRRQAFDGMCHLGLFELIEPLEVGSALLGVFYYGAVAVVERETDSLSRITRYCKRRSIEPAPFVEAWRRVPRIREADIPTHRARLHLLVETVRLWCDALAIPVERYPVLRKNAYWQPHRTAPFLVRSALKYVAFRYSQPCRVADIAAKLHCNANYLSGEFKRHVGVNLTEHIQRVRIERAKAMLRTGQFSIGEVGFRCGFSDTSHFIRTFKKAEGRTPKSFQLDPGSVVPEPPIRET